jgi:hypothetical protein
MHQARASRRRVALAHNVALRRPPRRVRCDVRHLHGPSNTAGDEVHAHPRAHGQHEGNHAGTLTIPSGQHHLYRRCPCASSSELHELLMVCHMSGSCAAHKPLKRRAILLFVVVVHAFAYLRRPLSRVGGGALPRPRGRSSSSSSSSSSSARGRRTSVPPSFGRACAVSSTFSSSPSSASRG